MRLWPRWIFERALVKAETPQFITSGGYTRPRQLSVSNMNQYCSRLGRAYPKVLLVWIYWSGVMLGLRRILVVKACSRYCRGIACQGRPCGASRAMLHVQRCLQFMMTPMG